jgi:hypothetical protein
MLSLIKKVIQLYGSEHIKPKAWIGSADPELRQGNENNVVKIAMFHSTVAAIGR